MAAHITTRHRPRRAVVLCPAHCCSVGFVRLSSAGIRDMPYMDPFMILYTIPHAFIINIHVFFLADGASDTSPTVSPIRIRKSEYLYNYNWEYIWSGEPVDVLSEGTIGIEIIVSIADRQHSDRSRHLQFYISKTISNSVCSDQVFVGREWERAFAFRMLFVLSLISHFGVFRCEPVGFLRVSHRQFSPLRRPRIEL